MRLSSRYRTLLFLQLLVSFCLAQTDSTLYYTDRLVDGINQGWESDPIEEYIRKHDLRKHIFKTHEEIARRLSSDRDKFLLYISTAYTYYDVSEYKETQELLMQALRSAEASGSKGMRSSAYNMIGNVFSELRRSDEAIFYFRKGIEVMKQAGRDSVLGVLYNNFANAFYRDAERYPAYFDSSRMYNEAALALAEKYKSLPGKLSAYQSLGLIETDLKNYALAENYLRKAIHICNELQDDETMYFLQYELGRMYASTKEQSKADSALKYLEISMRAAKAYESPSMINDILFQFSLAYYNKGDYKTSADYALRFSEYNDSLSLLKSAGDIAELSEKYESAKKEATIKELNLQQLEKQEQINRQLYMIVAAVVILIFVIIVSFVLYRTNLLRKKANQELTEKNVLIESQKQKVEEQSKLIQEKNKEIIDSIRYAQRIQKALLPNEKMLRRIFKRNIDNP
jgi:tetratricopeptide (TPR) repeat protein